MRPYEIKITETLDRGLAYAESCFETCRVVRGEIFSLPAHVQRLQTGMKAFGWDVSSERVAHWFQLAIQAAAAKGDDLLLRLTVSGGEASWGFDGET